MPTPPRLPGIEPVGLALHLGSQIVSMAPYRAAFARAAELIRTLRAQGLPVARMDCGGGLGIGYQDEAAASPAAFAGAIRAAFANMDLSLAIEPGRWLVGPAGVLLTAVVLVKGGGRFVVLDAAMNDLLRPAMYDAWHGIVPLSAGRRRRRRLAGRHRRAGLRKRRHIRAKPTAADPSRRRPRRDPRCRCLWCGDEFDLQRPPACPDRAGRRRRGGR